MTFSATFLGKRQNMCRVSYNEMFTLISSDFQCSFLGVSVIKNAWVININKRQQNKENAFLSTKAVDIYRFMKELSPMKEL